MAKNKMKAEYEGASSRRVVPMPSTTLSFDQVLRLTGDNRQRFKDAFGKQSFQWEPGCLCWRFHLFGGWVAYVFTGVRGTSYEIANLEDWQLAHDEPSAEGVMTSFIKERILPVCHSTQTPSATSSPKSTDSES